MFFSKKDKTKTGQKPQGVNKKAGGSGGDKNAGQRPSSDSIREQALANARAARERLGDDYIQEIAGILKKQQNMPTPQQAKAKIMASDPDRVAAEILLMLEDKD